MWYFLTYRIFLICRRWDDLSTNQLDLVVKSQHTLLSTLTVQHTYKIRTTTSSDGYSDEHGNENLLLLHGDGVGGKKGWPYSVLINHSPPGNRLKWKPIAWLLTIRSMGETSNSILWSIKIQAFQAKIFILCTERIL